jgi:DNA-binding MarR family transcriptional regulator
MPVEHLRDLEVLEAIAQNELITQRNLAAKLGIALGLTNLYVRRLARKGLIKCVNVQSNRLRYLLTPRGIAEKSRLTFEYLEYSLFLYRQVRGHLRNTLLPLAHSGKRVAIYGAGEAAELAYLSLREAGLEPTAIFDGTGSKQFVGAPVRDIQEQATVEYDLMIVATLEPPGALMAELIAAGVTPEKLIMLRPPEQPRQSRHTGTR